MREINMGKRSWLVLIAVLAALFVFAGCSPITGSGTLKTESREAAGFTKISISGISSVILQPGETEGVMLEADDNLLSVLESRVENGTLYLGAKNGVNIVQGTVRYTVTYRTLESISASGSTHVQGTGLNAQDFSLDQSGSSEATLAGTVQNLNTVNSGSSILKASSLTAQNANLVVSGSASVEVNAETSITAVLSGSSQLVYSGNAQVNQTLSGSATIKKAQ
jgi:hypothetical protein